MGMVPIEATGLKLYPLGLGQNWESMYSPLPGRVGTAELNHTLVDSRTTSSQPEHLIST